jgi:exopolyphosphatase / guanosine-5'-triphosphate,3'-diphosphate pyrophosphatase
MSDNVAAVDIGTNSVRLLITDARGNPLAREMQITRLGQGVDIEGKLSDEAIARTTTVLAEYGDSLRRHGATRVRATATSAARDALNREDFFDAAERALGVRPELLPGEEEAALSFAGATVGLDRSSGPFLVVDIGGGSTEFVLGTETPEQLISVDMGCVRMTERHLRHDPAHPEELLAIRADVVALLAGVRARVDVKRARRMIGLAGTITAVAYLHMGLRHYDPARSHRALLTRDAVDRVFAELAAKDVGERRAALLEPKRAEVIVGGTAVLHAILHELDIHELTVSESDILDGLAQSLR